MYEQFYGLTERPFRISPDPDYLYLSDQHRLALVYLEYGLVNQEGFVVITGEIGTGKTTLVRTLLRRMVPEMRVAFIFNTRVLPGELLEMVLREFEVEHGRGGKADSLDALHHFLIEEYRRGHRVVLIVDEAQNLSLETLEEIRLISNLQTEKEHLLQIVLVGQPDLRAKLSHPRLAQLAQRVSVHYHLAPLGRAECEAYVAHRLKVAGRVAPLFAPEAFDLIFAASGGTPRLINIICDAALVYGFADGLPLIGPAVVEQAVADKQEGALLFAPTPEEAAPAQGAVSAAGPVEARLRSLEERVDEMQALLAGRGEGPERADSALVLELEARLAEERRKGEGLLAAQRRDAATIHELRRELAGLRERLAALEEPATAPRPEPSPAAEAPPSWWSRLLRRSS